MNELTPAQVALQNLAVNVYLNKRTKAGSDAARHTAGENLSPGDSLTVRSVLDGTRYARVTMTDPKPVARVVDRDAVEGWAIDHDYGDKLVGRTEIVGPMSEVIAVLRQHAPHLVDEVHSLPDWALHELRVRSEEAGEPVGWGGEMGEHAPPGIEVSTPRGVIQVRLESAVERVVADYLAAGRIQYDGTVKHIEGETA